MPKKKPYQKTALQWIKTFNLDFSKIYEDSSNKSEWVKLESREHSQRGIYMLQKNWLKVVWFLILRVNGVGYNKYNKFLAVFELLPQIEELNLFLIYLTLT